MESEEATRRSETPRKEGRTRKAKKAKVYCKFACISSGAHTAEQS